MNKIVNLKQLPFANLSLEEKLEIKRLGKPCPILKIDQPKKPSSGKKLIKSFSREYYERYEWLCGCEVSNKLFCFPCVLFGGERLWATSGYDDMNHLPFMWKKHEQGKLHLRNVTRFSLLKKTSIAASLSNTSKRSVEDHNKKVNENRYVLNLIINCIKFCGFWKLALQGNNEMPDCSKPLARGSVSFNKELDRLLKSYIKEEKLAKYFSKTIQRELLECMLEVCQEYITREMEEANFFSIIADETGYTSNIFQLTLIFRYLVGHKPVERFFTFLQTEQHNAKSMATSIVKTIENLKLTNAGKKFIAQTYNGAIIMSEDKQGVHALVKEVFPRANLVHSFVNQLTLVFTKAALVTASVRIFFANLNGLCAFFSPSPQRTPVLDAIIEKKLPKLPPNRWSAHSRAISTIIEHKEAIKECLQEISMTALNHTSIQQATGLLKNLEDDSFRFWLKFFNLVMPLLDMLYSFLQRRGVEPKGAKMKMLFFENEILKIRNNLHDDFEEPNAEEKRPKIDICGIKGEAEELCDLILNEVKNRFDFTGHWSASALLLKERFPSYQKAFPRKILTEAVKDYSLEESRLKTELEIIYANSEFSKIPDNAGFLTVISENNLSSILRETYKMCQILVTIPTSPTLEDRATSTLNNVKLFFRNTQDENNLNALAMLAIEQNLVHSIQDFNHKVIKKFAQLNDRRMELLYK